MTHQLNELRHWISSLEQHQLLFEHQPNEADLAVLDRPECDDAQAQE